MHLNTKTNSQMEFNVTKALLRFSLSLPGSPCLGGCVGSYSSNRLRNNRSQSSKSTSQVSVVFCNPAWPTPRLCTSLRRQTIVNVSYFRLCECSKHPNTILRQRQRTTLDVIILIIVNIVITIIIVVVVIIITIIIHSFIIFIIIIAIIIIILPYWSLKGLFCVTALLGWGMWSTIAAAAVLHQSVRLRTTTPEHTRPKGASKWLKPMRKDPVKVYTRTWIRGMEQHTITPPPQQHQGPQTRSVDQARPEVAQRKMPAVRELQSRSKVVRHLVPYQTIGTIPTPPSPLPPIF